MASISIMTHLPKTNHQFNKAPRLFVSKTQGLASLGFCSRGFRGTRLLGNGMLVRAEDKVRGRLAVDETSSSDFEANYKPKTDFLKALAIFAAAATGTITINHSWVTTNQDVAMALLFGIGYAGIIFEESLAFNKSGVGLIMAVCLWIVRSIGASSTDVAVAELHFVFKEVLLHPNVHI